MSITDNLSLPREIEGTPPPTPSEPARPLTPIQIFFYSLANLGYGAFYSFNNATLPLFLKQFTNNPVLLGLMGSTHSVEGAIIQPLVGTASDRLRSRWGRRRPFMLLFTPLSALFLLLTPAAIHLPSGVRLGAIIGSIFLFTVFFNIAFDPYQALMPDITPPEQRGRVTSVWALVGVIGQAAILLLQMPLAVKFSLVAVAMLVTTLFTCQLIGERPATGDVSSSRSHWVEIGEAVRGLGILHQARKGILVFFLSGVGIGAVLPFLTIFVQKITGCTDHQAEMMFLVLMVATAFGVMPAGWLADRLGPKRVLLLGLSLIALAALNGLWVHTLTQVGIVLFVAGLGNAAQSASAYPLLTDIVPAEEVGFYTGLQTMALSIAQPLTVFLTGELIAHSGRHGGYRMIFFVCSISILAALIVLAFLQMQDAPTEIAARRAERRLSEA